MNICWGSRIVAENNEMHLMKKQNLLIYPLQLNIFWSTHYNSKFPIILPITTLNFTITLPITTPNFTITSNTTSWRHYVVHELHTRRYQGHEPHFVSSEDFKSTDWILSVQIIIHKTLDGDTLSTASDYFSLKRKNWWLILLYNGHGLLISCHPWRD